MAFVFSMNFKRKSKIFSKPSSVNDEHVNTSKSSPDLGLVLKNVAFLYSRCVISADFFSSPSALLIATIVYVSKVIGRKIKTPEMLKKDPRDVE